MCLIVTAIVGVVVGVFDTCNSHSSPASSRSGSKALLTERSLRSVLGRSFCGFRLKGGL